MFLHHLYTITIVTLISTIVMLSGMLVGEFIMNAMGL